MIPLAIAGVNLRRILRDRTNLFFVVLFPLLMILVLGVAFGGSYQPRLAVVADGGALTARLVEDLRGSDAFDVHAFDSRATAVDAVEEGRVEGVVVVPATYDAELRAGRDVAVEYLSRGDRTAQQVAQIVSAVVGAQSSRVKVARVFQVEAGGSLAAALATTAATAAAVPDVRVVTTTTGTALFPADLGRFDLGASGELTLFVFITSMTTAAALIETRRLGVSRRMLAAPVRVGAVVAGEALGRVAIAVVQGLVIMAGAALLFGVNWGDPVAAAALMLMFALVAGAAGMLLGASASTPEQAIAVGLLLGLGMSALGGSMMPLEFFSDTMLKVAHLTPHAWVADGFATLVRHDGGLLDILPELGVLAGYAVVLFALASWSLRRRIVRG